MCDHRALWCRGFKLPQKVLNCFAGRVVLNLGIVGCETRWPNGDAQSSQQRVLTCAFFSPEERGRAHPCGTELPRDERKWLAVLEMKTKFTKEQMCSKSSQHQCVQFVCFCSSCAAACPSQCIITIYLNTQCRKWRKQCTDLACIFWVQIQVKNSSYICEVIPLTASVARRIPLWWTNHKGFLACHSCHAYSAFLLPNNHVCDGAVLLRSPCEWTTSCRHTLPNNGLGREWWSGALTGGGSSSCSWVGPVTWELGGVEEWGREGGREGEEVEDFDLVELQVWTGHHSHPSIRQTDR